MAAVLEVSFTDVATVIQLNGHVNGPNDTAVCIDPAFPRLPCSHHVVTAGG